MRKRIRMTIGLFLAVAAVAVAAWLVWGREQQPRWRDYWAVQSVIDPEATLVTSGPVPGKAADPAYYHSEQYLAYIQPLRDALAAPDPEAALIGVMHASLASPSPEGPFPRGDMVPTGAELSRLYIERTRGDGAAALLGMGGIGGQRAAAALREVIQAGYQVEQQPDGIVVTRWYCPFCNTEKRWGLEENLWMVENLNQVPPDQQLARIAEKVESLIAADLPATDKRDLVGMMVGRLADLGLPGGLPILRRIREANAAYFEAGQKDPSQIGRPQDWFPVSEAIRLIQKLDDPAALDLLEPLTHPLHFAGATGPGGTKDVGATWWRLKLKTLPQGQWPQAVADAIRNCYIGAQPHTPSAALDGLEAAAETVGPACLPLVREVAFDPNVPKVAIRRAPNQTEQAHAAAEKELAEVPHFFALKVLGKLRDVESLPTLRQLALDPAQFEQYRWNLAHCIGQIGGAAARDALLEIAHQALTAGQLNLARVSLGELTPWPSTTPPPTPDQVAFLEMLARDSALSDSAAVILDGLRRRGLIP